jgi:LmeA-like phospholipid-binding
VAEVYGTRPRKRWGRRLLITFLVLLIIVVAILAVVDRVGASYAERVIGDQVSEQVAGQDATSAKPEVTVEGIPFLTQVVRGNYQEIKILLRDFSGPAGNGKTIKMPLLDVRAKDVRAPLDTLRTRQGDIIATTVTGAGTIDYATLAELSGQDGVKLAEKDGKLAVTAPLKVLNQQVTINGTAKIEVAQGNVVRVRFEQVTADGLPDVPLVDTALNNYARRLSLDLAVPALPLKLQVEKVQPTPAGLVVTAGAKEVTLNAGGI